jgi:catechol 2,3-dioxygenase-like lactoylglutathione lyase family enzyme
MITQIRHTGIVTDDIEILLFFYRDLLGFKVKAHDKEEGAFIDTVLGLQGAMVTTVKLVAPDGSILELLHYQSHPRPKTKMAINNTGISHVAYTVDDIDRDYERLKNEGIEFYSLPQTNPDGTARVVFCEDPKGNILELVEVL